jgi:predicted TIM-barrel fold metal-dependent hydrolase
MVGVLLAGNPVGRPFGDVHFDPIYEAAAELGLPVSIHVAADRPSYQIRAVGGRKATMLEDLSQFAQQAMHYVSSYVIGGAFERHPRLRVVVLEYGIAWLPWLMYSLDNQVNLLRQESSWLKRMPSEYVLDHMSFTIQPIEEGPDRRALLRLLDLYEGIDRLLCFSSDYPHPSMDDPMYVARLLPRDWHERFFYGNACALYGFPTPLRAAPAVSGVAG